MMPESGRRKCIYFEPKEIILIQSVEAESQTYVLTQGCLILSNNEPYAFLQ